MAAEASAWKKPSDVMKMRQKRKLIVRSRSLDGRVTTSGSLSSPGNTPSPDPMRMKRRNPFSCSQPTKRLNSCDEGEQNSPKVMSPCGSLLFEGLNSTEWESKKPVYNASSQAPVHAEVFSPVASPVVEEVSNDSNTPQSSPAAKVNTDMFRDFPYFPTDWSLRTKIRYVSSKPLNWCSKLKSSEEAAGLTSFVCATPDAVTQDVQSTGSSVGTDAQGSFQRHCMYWMHPNLPWLKLFPRIIHNAKMGKGCALAQDEEIQQAIMADWSSSFTSAFHLLRSGMCPYFYMCTHQFSVLFRAAGVGGRTQPHATLTPTSRGFREKLTKEGIEFSMPLLPKGTDVMEETDENQPDNNEQKPSEPTDETAAAAEDMSEGSEERAWLESIGLNASKFRALDPNKIKLQKEGYRVIDHRPESTVLMEGGDCQALFNYLLNCRSCVAITGPQSGIPPTLIAPTAFQGATLQTLKSKCGSVRQGGDSAAYSVELTGPILPHTVHGLTQLFSRTQDQFTCTGSVHEPSTPFNSIAAESSESSSSEDIPEKLKVSGIQLSHLENIVKDYSLGKYAMRELLYQNRLYSWAT